jgi:cytochrome c551/c552
MTFRIHRAIPLLLLGWAVYSFFPAAPAPHTAPVEPFVHPIALAQDQSSCLACHRNVYDIAEQAPELADGRRLFTTLGCIDCHRMDSIAEYEKRKIGPDLRHIISKLSPAFVARWIADPAAFRPSTSMPRIFSPHDDQLLTETAAITAYLYHYAAPLPEAKEDLIPPNLTPNNAHGRLLFRGHGLDDVTAAAAGLPPGLKAGIGCLACHADPSDGPPTTPHFGPDLSVVGQKLLSGSDRASAQQWLYSWLRNPRNYNDKTLMPNLRLTEQEALDLSEYLLNLTKPTGSNPWASPPDQLPNPTPATLALGAKLIIHYGCANCHEIASPAIGQTALDLSDWGDKPLDRLDFARLDSAHHTRRDWLQLHLTDSEVPAANQSYDMPRMPIFHLPPAQAHAIATFVLGNRNWPVDPALARRAMNGQALALAKGRAITTLHNCIGCHQTESNTPLIQQYFASAWISSYAPPPLRGEGSKVQPAWLKEFIAHVTPIRPLPMVRMPTFSLDASDIAALSDYFHAAGEKESRDLRRWIAGNRCNELDTWAIAHGQAAAIDLNPAYSTPAEIAKTQRDIQFKAEFTADLYGADADSPKPTGSHPWALGVQFLHSLQCLDCHAMSPAATPVDPAHAKAPNLDLTARRLQPRWVRAWIQEPDIVQHGTNMPPYFTGLPIYNLDGQPLAAAMKLSPSQAAAFDPFGRAVGEQTQLLIDFLYAAGAQQAAITAGPPLK